jgi:diacylglycerol kinase (CTP)
MNHSTGRLSTMLHRRSELHPLRKLWHVGAGLALYWIVFHCGLRTPQAVLLLGLLLTADLAIELARLRFPALNRIVLALFGPLMRSREAQGLSGTPYYLAGTLTAILVFPDQVARLSLLYLALGDPAASLAGTLSSHRGARFTRGKTLIGTAASIAVCTAVTFLFFAQTAPSPSPGTHLLLTLGGGVAGATAELIPLPLDDNLTYPVLSGLVIWPLYGLLL